MTLFENVKLELNLQTKIIILPVASVGKLDTVNFVLCKSR